MRKLVERFGERLVRVRYLYDADSGRRLKIVELIVQSIPWKPRSHSPRRATTTSCRCASPGTKSTCASAPSGWVRFGVRRKSSGRSAGPTRAAWV